MSDSNMDKNSEYLFRRASVFVFPREELKANVKQTHFIVAAYTKLVWQYICIGVGLLYPFILTAK